LTLAIRGTIDTGRSREMLAGSLRSYPNDGEYLFSVGLESGARLSRHGGQPALGVLLAALSAFPAVVARGHGVISLSSALGGLRAADDTPDDSGDHSDQSDHSPDSDHTPDDSDHSDQSDHSPDSDHTPDDSDHSDQSDHSPDSDHTPDDSDHSDQSDHSPDDSQSVIDVAAQFESVFEQWATTLLETSAGEYDARLVLDLVGGRTTADVQVRRTGDVDFEASADIESTHEVADIGDLVRMLPLDYVLVPVGPGDVTLRGEVHMLRADGEIVSGSLTGRLTYDGEKSLDGPVLVSHTFSPSRLSQHPVSVQALGIARSLTVRASDEQ